MKLKLIFISMFLLYAPLFLHGAFAEYYIKALGLKIVRLRLEHNPGLGQVNVKATSLMANKLFPRIDNDYIVQYDKNYLPLSYSRKVNQDSNKDVVTVAYKRNTSMANMHFSKSNEVTEYRIDPLTRDYFSFLMMLSNSQLNSGTHTLDGNGKLWKTQLEFQGVETIKSPMGKHKTRKYRLRFIPIDDYQAPYIDMVTHNLLNEDTTVVIWISEDKVAVKATVSKGLLGMQWELIKYEN